MPLIVNKYNGIFRGWQLAGRMPIYIFDIQHDTDTPNFKKWAMNTSFSIIFQPTTFAILTLSIETFFIAFDSRIKVNIFYCEQ